jgi:hypothetical protein
MIPYEIPRIILSGNDLKAVTQQKVGDRRFGAQLWPAPAFRNKVVTGNTNVFRIEDRLLHTFYGQAFGAFDIHLEKIDMLDV